MDTTTKTTEAPSAIPPDLMADLEYAVQLAASGKNDPEFEARIRARSEQVREDVFRRHGPLNVAVDLVREARDEG